MNEAQALTMGTTNKSLKQALLFLRRKYGIKPRDVDAYAVNWDPKLFSPSARRHAVATTFKSLIAIVKEGIGFHLGLFQGDIIDEGLDALRIGLLYLRGDYLDLARMFVRFVIHPWVRMFPIILSSSPSLTTLPMRLRLINSAVLIMRPSSL